MSSGAVVKWDQSKIDAIRRNTMKGLLSMGYEIQRQAKDNAPWLSGDLSRSIRTTTENDTVYVVAGGSVNGKTIAYARLREYENNAHPDKRYYMRRAFDNVMRNGYSKYLKEALK